MNPCLQQLYKWTGKVERRKFEEEPNNRDITWSNRKLSISIAEEDKKGWSLKKFFCGLCGLWLSSCEVCFVPGLAARVAADATVLLAEVAAGVCVGGLDGGGGDGDVDLRDHHLHDLVAGSVP